jgi:dTDP-4-amino-4,6-dideoxygalactose transaminase
MDISFAKPSFSPDSRQRILAAIDGILRSGRLIFGEHNQRFESAFRALTGSTFALSTNSCTTALQICLTHYDVRDAEVLVPAAAFITDVSVIRWCGGVPVLVDIDPQTLSFDLDDLRRKLTPRTKGIIWIHLTGFISPAWREIVAFAREAGLFLIEDCAHAHGASVEGRQAGSLGDAGCFSFFATKVLTCGTGGMIVTNDDALASTAKELRLFGRDKGSGPVVRAGNDWFLDELRACLACEQTLELPEFLRRRRAVASRYQTRFSEASALRLLYIPEDNHPAWYHYTVFVSESVDITALMKNLACKHGIPSRAIYPPIHEELIFRYLDDGTLGRTAHTLHRSLCLPMHAELTESDADTVADAVIQELPVI